VKWGDSVHVVKKGQREKAKSTGHKAGGREQKNEQEMDKRYEQISSNKNKI
jgi:hypothetical protein